MKYLLVIAFIKNEVMKRMLFLLFSILGSCVVGQVPKYYRMKMELYNERTERVEDTVLLLKSCIEDDSLFRVIVKKNVHLPHEIIQLIYEYQKKNMRDTYQFSYIYFIDVYKDKEYYIVPFYCCIRGHAFKQHCYKIKDGKIIAINICPGFTNEFIQIEEYERGQYEGYND